MLDRRHFLTAVAASAVTGLAACSDARAVHPTSLAMTSPAAPSATSAAAGPAAPQLVKMPLPGDGVLRQLPTPAGDRVFALTVDDGCNSEVVRAYTEFARDSGIRLTYFVNGMYEGWTQHKALLRPLVDSGQIQLGNHTWSHPNLTSLSEGEIDEQLNKNAAFLKSTYGVDGRPFYRPPYGFHNETVDRIASGAGYKCATIWNGSFGDSSVVEPWYIVKMARKYFEPNAVVIGHLNHPAVTHTYAQLIDTIRRKNLRTVTLNDVFV